MDIATLKIEIIKKIITIDDIELLMKIDQILQNYIESSCYVSESLIHYNNEEKL
jgi:hypothetical protein